MFRQLLKQLKENKYLVNINTLENGITGTCTIKNVHFDYITIYTKKKIAYIPINKIIGVIHDEM